MDGVYNQCSSESEYKRVVRAAHPISNGGEAKLLVV